METYNVIGLMSGTSLDGLDIAYCSFSLQNKRWSFSIKKTATIKYGKPWLKKLSGAHHLAAEGLLMLHNEYGIFLGISVAEFVKKHGLRKVDFIASHGHTIFHQPEKHFTFQLGNGAAIAARSSLPAVCDFRSLDVMLGGQGAPLVPIGDKLLFPEYDYCLNLGGIANISYENKGQRIAFDVCPVNIALNYLAGYLNKEYDKDGDIAAKGIVNNAVLKKLNALPYYKAAYPKSIGREWVEEKFLPLLDSWHAPVEDKIATVTEHIAMQIARVIKDTKAKVLVTGGGAFNKYLIKRIRALSAANVVVPDKEIINYKEALVFAFLGVLRWRGEINCLRSVTGASENNSGGAIYLHVS